MAFDGERGKVTAGMQRSTAGAFSYAVSGLMVFTTFSSNFLGELWRTGSVVLVILLALNLCTIGFQVSLCALNSSVQND